MPRAALLEQCTNKDIYIIRKYRFERHKRQDTNAESEFKWSALQTLYDHKLVITQATKNFKASEIKLTCFIIELMPYRTSDMKQAFYRCKAEKIFIFDNQIEIFLSQKFIIVT